MLCSVYRRWCHSRRCFARRCKHQAFEIRQETDRIGVFAAQSHPTPQREDSQATQARQVLRNDSGLDGFHAGHMQASELTKLHACIKRVGDRCTTDIEALDLLSITITNSNDLRKLKRESTWRFWKEVSAWNAFVPISLLWRYIRLRLFVNVERDVRT